MTAVADKADVTLHLVGETREAIVFADPREIASAVINLVDNAVKYSNPGDEIWLGVERGADGTITFGCKDEGIGISEADQANLFLPLFRSTNEDALRRPGTGLGLGIVRRDHAAPRRHRGGRVAPGPRHVRTAALPAAASGRVVPSPRTSSTQAGTSWVAGP